MSSSYKTVNKISIIIRNAYTFCKSYALISCLKTSQPEDFYKFIYRNKNNFLKIVAYQMRVVHIKRFFSDTSVVFQQRHQDDQKKKPGNKQLTLTFMCQRCIIITLIRNKKTGRTWSGHSFTTVITHREFG